MSGLLKQVQKELIENSTPEAKASAMKFVPNAEKVYGVRMPGWIINRAIHFLILF